MVSPIFRFTCHLYCKYKEHKSHIGTFSLMIVCPHNGIRNSLQNVHDCLNASESWKPRTLSLGKGLANLLHLCPQPLVPCRISHYKRRLICSAVCLRDVMMCLREDGTVRQVGKPAISQYAKMNGLRYVINASTSVPTAPIVSFHH